MSHVEAHETQPETRGLPAYSQSARSNCPDCNASLAVLRVMGGRAGCEYWTMRCTRCGGIHLDIVKASRTSLEVTKPGG
jgi:uncharacterized Zn finger protein